MESAADRRANVDEVPPATETPSIEQPSSSRLSFKPRALLQLLKRPSLLISESARHKSLRYAFLLFTRRNERCRLASVFGHGNRRFCVQNTQIITEVDFKLNKWHIAIEKLYRKPTETEQNFKKI